MTTENDFLPEQDASAQALAAAKEGFRALLEPAPPSPALRARIERACVSARREDLRREGLRRRWTLLSAGLAAAVAFSASAWLFVHLLATPVPVPQAEGPDTAQRVTGGDGEDDPAKRKLEKDREKEIDALLAKLESEDFAERKEAHEALVKLGMSARAQVVRRLAQAKDPANANANLAAELGGILGRIDAAHRSVVVSEAQREVDRAVNEAPAHYAPPDAALLARLQENVSVAARKGESPRGWLAAAADTYNLPILLDPQAFPPLPENTSEFDLQLNAVDWTLGECVRTAAEQVGGQLVVRNTALIVTSAERAQRLRLEQKTLPLPGGWSLEETRALARILAKWPVQQRLKKYRSPTFKRAAVLRAEAAGAGKALVAAEDWSWPLLDAFAKSFAPGGEPFDTDYQIWSDSQLKRWNELEALIDTEIEGPLPEQRWAEILNRLAADAKTTLIAECEDWKAVENPEVATLSRLEAARPSPTGHQQYMFNGKSEQLKFLLAKGSGMEQPRFGVADQRATVRKVLQDAAERFSFSVSMGPHWLLWVVKPRTRFSGMDAQPFVLDLRSALDAGIEEKALTERLAGLLRQAALKPEGFVLRGRWLAAADPWTHKRAVDLVQRAAKDKRLPAEDPPAPWFFATFPKR